MSVCLFIYLLAVFYLPPSKKQTKTKIKRAVVSAYVGLPVTHYTSYSSGYALNILFFFMLHFLAFL